MTSRTEESRPARSAPYGTSNGIPACASVRLARTIRWATVGSEESTARAISAVVRPPSSRSVSAIRASADSTGWQTVKISRSRSSSMSSGPAGSGGGTSSSARPTSASLRAYVSRRRTRSTARCLAVAMSQAPGRSGTPDPGHCSRAATSASCASSSAMPMSRTMRVTPAMIRADSIRNTASTVLAVSAPPASAPPASVAPASRSVTITHQSSRHPGGQTVRPGRRRPPGHASGGVAASSICRSSAPTVQLPGWTSRKRRVHSTASAMSLHWMIA